MCDVSSVIFLVVCSRDDTSNATPENGCQNCNEDVGECVWGSCNCDRANTD